MSGNKNDKPRTGDGKKGGAKPDKVVMKLGKEYGYADSMNQRHQPQAPKQSVWNRWFGGSNV